MSVHCDILKKSNAPGTFWSALALKMSQPQVSLRATRISPPSESDRAKGKETVVEATD
jgi:hypothetical protein